MLKFLLTTNYTSGTFLDVVYQDEHLLKIPKNGHNIEMKGRNNVKVELCLEFGV